VSDVVVNGQRRTVGATMTIADLVRELGGEDARGVAVAVNGEVALRRSWESSTLREGDQVDVLSAVQGG